MIRKALALAILGLLAACAGTGGAMTAVVDDADMASRTIMAGGQLMYVPEPINIISVMPGSRYEIRYSEVEGRRIVSSIAEVGTRGKSH